MKISLRSVDIQRKVKMATEMTKVAQDLLSEYAPERMALNEEIFNDTQDLGNRYYDSDEFRAYLDYLRSLSDERSGEPTFSPIPKGTEEFPEASPMNEMGGLTPSEYLGLFGDQDNMGGYDLGMGAYNAYDSMDPYKLGSEKVAHILNEIIKVGRADKEIQKKIRNGEKVAHEMNVINKDYFVKLMGELVG